MMDRSRSRLNPIQALQVKDRDITQTVERLGNRDRSVNWIALTLLNGFSNFGSGYAVAAFKRHSSGLVEVKGLITRAAGTPAPGTNIAVLPVGFRPSENRLFGTDGGGAHGRVDVAIGGAIVYNAGAVTYFSIECCFSAEQ